MIAEIITVGTELLIGSTINTNGPFISKALTENGFDVRFHTSVKDNSEDLVSAIKLASSRSDIIIFSGGLGPTKDDLTKEILAETLGLKLVEEQKTWKKIEKKLKEFSGTYTNNNRKQALIIEGSTVIPNEIGTAPGDYIEHQGRKYILLPGPPREFEPMAKYAIKELLKEKLDKIFIESLNLVQIGESACESRIRELNLEKEYLEINTFAKAQEVEIKVLANTLGKYHSKDILEDYNKAIEILKKEFSNNYYASGDTSLEKELVKKMIIKGTKVSFAESVTGGLLSHKITSVPDASKVIEKSFLTYSNEAKISLLGVKENTIKKFGVVSLEVAKEMAKGCYELTGSDYCIATTGEAGPISSSSILPGTVCYSIYRRGEELISNRLSFSGDRGTIQRRVSKHVLSKLFFLI